MRRVEELAGFQEHFDDMAIYMPAGSLAWVRMEGKDVHGRVLVGIRGAERGQF